MMGLRKLTLRSGLRLILGKLWGRWELGLLDLELGLGRRRREVGLGLLRLDW